MHTFIWCFRRPAPEGCIECHEESDPHLQSSRIPWSAGRLHFAPLKQTINSLLSIYLLLITSCTTTLTLQWTCPEPWASLTTKQNSSTAKIQVLSLLKQETNFSEKRQAVWPNAHCAVCLTNSETLTPSILPTRWRWMTGGGLRPRGSAVRRAGVEVLRGSLNAGGLRNAGTCCWGSFIVEVLAKCPW